MTNAEPNDSLEILIDQSDGLLVASNSKPWKLKSTVIEIDLVALLTFAPLLTAKYILTRGDKHLNASVD